MFEAEPSTLKEKILRVVVGIFLFLLVGMLVITFLPGDAEQSFLGAITGQSSTKAGTIGGKTVPVDYLNGARRDCYFQYQRYGREIAGNSEMILSCAFSTVKELFVARDISEAVGYRVSELSIKRLLSEEARNIHKQSRNQAGYGEEDTRSAEEIYQQILRSVPMNYRVDTAVGYSLFPSFLDQKLEPSSQESTLSAEAKQAKVSFRVVAFTDVELLNKLDSKIQVSEEEIQKEFEKEQKDSPSEKKTLEERRSILVSKIKFDKKRSELDVWKRSLEKLTKQENALEEISKNAESVIESITFSPLQELSSLKSNTGKPYRLGADAKFWEEMASDPFGKKRVAGPFQDGDKWIYVEFGDLILDSKTPIKIAEGMPEDPRGKKLTTFYIEISQALGAEYGIERQKALRTENAN